MPDVLITILWYLVLPMMFILLGAFWTYNAVHDFKKQKYFAFGFSVFMAIHSAFGVLEIMLEEPIV